MTTPVELKRRTPAEQLDYWITLAHQVIEDKNALLDALEKADRAIDKMQSEINSLRIENERLRAALLDRAAQGE